MIKKGAMYLHGYSTIEGRACKPKWAARRIGALVFSLGHAKAVASDLNGVLVRA